MLEYIINDNIVACLSISNPAGGSNDACEESFFSQVSHQLQGICTPPEGDLKFFDGGTYNPVYANNEDPDTGCSWVGGERSGGSGQVVLSLVNQPELRVRVAVKLKVAKDDSEAWLTVEYCPTTIFVGHNVHPVAVKDPKTGIANPYPSSAWGAMTRTFRLGFEFLEEMAGGALFDGQTRLAIERGEIHLVRVQWAATKHVRGEEIPQFLQLVCVIYGQTIARGEGIISNATHLGLEFNPYTNSETHIVNGVLFKKCHGAKPQFSVSLYDKRVRLEQMHQDSVALSVAEPRPSMEACARTSPRIPRVS
jgi:hypothetical protein